MTMAICDAQVVDVLDFGGDATNDVGIDAEALIAHQGFATEFQQDRLYLAVIRGYSPSASATSPARSVDRFSRPSPVLNRAKRRT